jgi:hypothetical protein
MASGVFGLARAIRSGRIPERPSTETAAGISNPSRIWF